MDIDLDKEIEELEEESAPVKRGRKPAAMATVYKKSEKPCGVDSCKYIYGARACAACINRIKE